MKKMLIVVAVAMLAGYACAADKPVSDPRVDSALGAFGAMIAQMHQDAMPQAAVSGRVEVIQTPWICYHEVDQVLYNKTAVQTNTHPVTLMWPGMEDIRVTNADGRVLLVPTRVTRIAQTIQTNRRVTTSGGVEEDDKPILVLG